MSAPWPVAAKPSPRAVRSGRTDTLPRRGQDGAPEPPAAVMRSTPEPPAAAVRSTPEPRLHGRGCAGMQGFIGCAFAQTERLLAADLPFALHCAFGCDVEAGGFGSRRPIADLRNAARALRIGLAGEPTGMIAAPGHKGGHRRR